MCGILAYYNKEGISTDRIRHSLDALDKISHRGPDGDGVLLVNTRTGENKLLKTNNLPGGIVPGIAIEEYIPGSYDLLLGHQRLSIFDTSNKGFQPMVHKPTGNWILFNGAVYNFIEIREELQKLGHLFISNSDTEVILAAYQQWGEKCLARFNGMWSIVIWDNHNRSVLISNDRYGIKPLYYIAADNEFFVCSEQKQLFAYPGAIKGYNRSNIDVFLEHGLCDYDESTLFEDVFRFKPSHFLSFKLAAYTQDTFSLLQPYYEIPIAVKAMKESDAMEEFHEILTDAVKLRMRSDVPYAFSISGGLDSSAVYYLGHELLKMQGRKSEIKGFSAVFPGMEGDESEFVKLIMKDLGVDVNFINPITGFSIGDFEKHIYHLDSPVPTMSFYAAWGLARYVSETGYKVLLMGQGSDEVFAGYHYHFYRYCRRLILTGQVLRYLSVVKDYCEIKNVSTQSIHKLVLNEVKLIVKFRMGLSSLKGTLLEHWYSAPRLIQLLKYDLTKYSLPFLLKCDDRSSMAFGIETRHPFMDYRVINFGFSIPDEMKINKGWQKWIIREAMKELPDSIRYRKDKKGFTIPQAEWLSMYREEFSSYLKFLSPLGVNTDKHIRNYSLGAWVKLNNLHPQPAAAVHG